MVSKVVYLGSLAIAGIIISSCFSWIAKIPQFRAGIVILTAIALLIWFIALGVDTELADYLKTQVVVVRSALVGGLICFLIGGLLPWMLLIL